MGPQNRKAIVLSDRGCVKSVLSYEEVYKFRDLITRFISGHIIAKNQCLGLRMIHNVYIPSIVLSLQELEHAFIFLPMEETDSKTIIQELNIKWVLSFDTHKKNTVLVIDDHTLSLESVCDNTEVDNFENIMYIIRTSGTTGQNKFVKVGKYSIESNIRCLSRVFTIDANDVIFFGTPLTFDPSMVELLLALSNGACLLITNPGNLINPRGLYETIFAPQNGATVLQIVPSLFQRWSHQQISSILSHSCLKILAFGGECFPADILRCNRSDNLRIFNLYGITEVSCWATACEIHDASDISIGDALDDTLIEVRSESGARITNGKGEIYIGSDTRICWIGKEPRNTLFRPTGDIGEIRDGKIFYKGRKNDVFKRFGCKLHLSKVEDLVHQETSIENKCVWSKTESKLLLFLVIENFENVAKDKILDKVRIKLMHALPKHCFPDYIDIIRKCPVTSHGKTDKRSLELLYLNRNPNDKQVVDIFKSMICKYFGFNETRSLQNATFFEIGGNSILAIQFLRELEEEIGECPELVTALFEKNLDACLDSIKSINRTKKRRNDPNFAQNCTVKRIKSDTKLKIVWSHSLDACVDSSPLIFESCGRLLVAVGSFSHVFVVLDATSGEEVAKFVLPGVIEASPCLSPCENYLYVGCFDGRMYSLDFMARKIAWSYTTRDRIKSTPVVCQQQGGIVFGSYDKHVHCVNAMDGALIWKTFVGESVVSTLLLEKANIYIATICGTCICLSQDHGQILWKYRSGGPIFGAPCHINDTILWPNVRGKVLCLSTNGVKMNEFECGSHLYSSLVVHDGSVIVTCQNGTICILKTNELEIVVKLDDALTTACVCGEELVVAGHSGRLFLVNFEGELLAELPFPGEIFSSPKFYNGKVYVGCRDNKLYCVSVTKV